MFLVRVVHCVFASFAIFLGVVGQTGGFGGQYNVHRRFEYKHSFKGPHLVQRDGTIPFWEHGGHAIASDESIRVTPSLRSKKGYVWNTEKSTLEHWEIEVSFRVTGRGRVGADGLAIWYTENKGVEGPVFGSNDKWNGLAIFFDSFDNDNQHNNPYVMAMGNDGTIMYEHKNDGANQQLGGCLRDFRNKPFPVRAKIEYVSKVLTVFFHNGMTNEAEGYELCLRVVDVILPKEGYFGISAATGGLADDHDVSSFITHSLRPTGGEPAPDTGKGVSEDDRKKFEQEFDEYYKKLQDAKEEYQKEHPESVPKYDYEFEGMEQRELKQIFDGQEGIHRVVRDLHRKLDEVIGRQERTLSQISVIQGGGAMQAGTGAGAGNAGIVDTIRRHEVDSLLNTNRDLVQSLREIKASVTDIARAKPAGVGAGYDNDAHFNEVKGHINSLQNEVKQLANQVGSKEPYAASSESSSCLSPSLFIIFTILQIVIFIGYHVYKNSREASAKKFY